MIQKFLLYSQLIWMIFMKTLKNKRKILIVFDDMIADVLSNKKLSPVATEYVTIRKKNISLVFITQSYFAVAKNISLNSTHYFVVKTPNKREL